MVDASFIVYEETVEGIGRYRLLETTRQYALERLRAQGQETCLREKHTASFLALAEEAGSHLSGGGEQELWLKRLEREQDNLRAALDFCIHAPNGAERGLRLAVALSRFWQIYGYLSEGRAYLSAVLAHPAGEEQNPHRGGAINAAATLARMQGDYPFARAYLREGLERAQQQGDRRGIILSLDTLGLVAREQGDYEAARTYHHQGLALCQEANDLYGAAHCLNNLGLVAYDQHDYTAAHAFYSEGLAHFREAGDQRGAAMSLSNLGLVASEQGDLPTARAWNEESLRLCREMGERYGTASCLNNLGLIACKQKDYTAARTFHEESLAIRRELGDKRGMAMSLSNQGLLAREKGDYDTARACHHESLKLCCELGEKYGVSEVLMGLFLLAKAQEQWRRATCLRGAIVTLRESIRAPLAPAESQALEDDLALLRTALGEEDFAATWAEGTALTLHAVVTYALQEQATP